MCFKYINRLMPFFGLFFLLTTMACTTPPEDENLILKGKITIDYLDQLGPGARSQTGPILVAVTRTSDYEKINADPQKALIEMVTADANTKEFEIDLTKTDIEVGNIIYLIAFVDNDYQNGVPFPNPGDWIGFYIDEENHSPTYQLKSGVNSNLHININRAVFNYSSKISGKIIGPQTGNVTLIAYKGAFDSLDFNDIDTQKIIGYQTISKKQDPIQYELSILPFGYDLPIEQVTIIAHLDDNHNGDIDEGDQLGFYKNVDQIFPTPLNIRTKALTDIDIEFKMEMMKPSGRRIVLEGNVEIEDPNYQTTDPIYLIVAKTENVDEVLTNPYQTIKYFRRLPQGTRQFSCDLSGTDLLPGDQIMLFTLIDKDQDLPFPGLSSGDYLGLFLQDDALSPTLTLEEGENTGITIQADREMGASEMNIHGTIKGDEKGRIRIIAYDGTISSFDFSQIDTQAIIGYKTIEKKYQEINYTLSILPIGNSFPITNVLILAHLDHNENGRIDGTDKVGFYQTQDTPYPQAITLSGEDLFNMDIHFEMEMDQPGTEEMVLSGIVNLPIDYDTSHPVYVIVTTGDKVEDIIAQPFSHIKHFIQLVKGESAFNINLSQTSLEPGDQVSVLGLLDKDFNGGLPTPSNGDGLGFYMPKDRLSPHLTLKKGMNGDITININQSMQFHETSISGKITGSDKGHVTVVAYGGELSLLDYTSLNIEKVFAYTTIEKEYGDARYSMQLLPFDMGLPRAGVKIIAFLDADEDQNITDNDVVGFYENPDTGFPNEVTISQNNLVDIDIPLTHEVTPPSGADLQLSGRIRLSTEAQLKKDASENAAIYILVAQAQDVNQIISNPIETIKYYEKLPENSDVFHCDLSQTDLIPGSRVLIIGLLDLDPNSEIPQLTQDDWIGLFIQNDAISPFYTLVDGANKGVEIKINRIHVPMNLNISGTVLGEDQGEVTVVAYQGTLDGFNLTRIDNDAVIGYQTLSKGIEKAPYTLSIIPFFHQTPVTQALILAVLDANENQQIDAGDKIGYFCQNDNPIPAQIQLNTNNISDIDIKFIKEVAPTAQQPISLQGRITIETDTTENDAPFYIIVAKKTDFENLLADPLSAIHYFEKLPQGATHFNIDLSQTGLAPGDEVMICALWDRNQPTTFPDPTAGDMLGFFIPEDTLSFGYALQPNENTDIHIHIDREIQPQNTIITGFIDGPETGNINLIAYKGEISSFDFNTIDPHKIIAFKNMHKLNHSLYYQLPVLPHGFGYPVNNVVMLAHLDVNGNGEIDPGDKIGFHIPHTSNQPHPIDIDSQFIDGIDMFFKMEIPTPKKYHPLLTGFVHIPETRQGQTKQGQTKQGQTGTVSIIITKKGDINEIVADPFAHIKYCEKLPQNQLNFSIDLSNTDLTVDDEIMVIGIMNTDPTEILPNLSNGNLVGIFQSKDRLYPTYTLRPVENDHLLLNLNREYSFQDIEITGTISGNPTGPTIICAYQGTLSSSNFTDLDMDKIVGYHPLNKYKYSQSYSFQPLPFAFNQDKILLIAVCDNDNDGRISPFDSIGFHLNQETGLPTTTTFLTSDIDGLDIEFKLQIPKPSGYNMCIDGALSTLEEDQTDENEIYIFITLKNDPRTLLTDPLSQIKYFCRLPKDAAYFDIDLSQTDLVPQDEIMVMALMDKNHSDGIPSINAGDKIGFLQNKTENRLTVNLTPGKNHLSSQGFNLDLNRIVYDFNASLRIDLDISNAGAYDPNTAQFLIMLVHVDGVKMTASPIGKIDYQLDMDYVLGLRLIPGHGISSPSNSTALDILPFVYHQVGVNPDSRPPTPLIHGYYHDNTFLEQTAYLLAILDKDGNGAYDEDDEIGFFGVETDPTNLGDTLDGLLGLSGLPSLDLDIPQIPQVIPQPIKRIMAGENLPDDGSALAYKIIF